MNHLDKFKNFIEDRNENVKQNFSRQIQLAPSIKNVWSRLLRIRIKNNDIASDDIKNTKKNEPLF